MDSIIFIKKTIYLSILLPILIFLCSCSTTSESTFSLVSNSLQVDAEYQGEENMGWAITHNVMYPSSEMDVNRAGIIEISFTVNEEGQVENIKVGVRDNDEPADLAVARKQISEKEVLGLNFAVLQSVINSVEMLQFKPAERNGRPVSSEFSTSVEFMLIP